MTCGTVPMVTIQVPTSVSAAVACLPLEGRIGFNVIPRFISSLPMEFPDFDSALDSFVGGRFSLCSQKPIIS